MRLSRPSPGLVVGIVALVSALAGSAVALPGQNTVDSGDIENGAVKRNDQAANQKTDWALLDLGVKGGDIIKQSGGISITEAGLGVAWVDFGKNVSGRAISATAQWPHLYASAVLCGGPPQGIICKFGNNKRHIYVELDNEPIKGPSHVYLAVLPK